MTKENQASIESPLQKCIKNKYFSRPKPPTINEIIEGYDAILKYQLEVRGPEILEKLSGNKDKGKKPKKKFLDIAGKDNDLDRLSKSTRSKKPILHRKILTVQQNDEHPPKHGWGKWHNLSKKEYGVYTQKVIERLRMNDLIININQEFENFENLDNSMDDIF